MKEKLINHVLGLEGGYADIANDSGGKTMRGITEALARKYGYTGQMLDLSYDLAFYIIETEFWEKLRLDEVSRYSNSLAAEMLDTGVNAGNRRAVEFLQRSLNAFNRREAYYPDLVIDGWIGRKTFAALKAFKQNRGIKGMAVLVAAMNCLQGEFYISLSERRQKDEDFTYGWIANRVNIPREV